MLLHRHNHFQTAALACFGERHQDIHSVFPPPPCLPSPSASLRKSVLRYPLPILSHRGAPGTPSSGGHRQTQTLSLDVHKPPAAHPPAGSWFINRVFTMVCNMRSCALTLSSRYVCNTNHVFPSVVPIPPAQAEDHLPSPHVHQSPYWATHI